MQTVAHSPLFKQAYNTPLGEYYDLRAANVQLSEIAFVDMNGMGRTNHTSIFPVIGVDQYDPCAAIIVYNHKNKKASVCHAAEREVDYLYKLIAQVRDNTEDMLSIHVIGMNQSPPDDVFSYNDDLQKSMHDIAEAVGTIPNAKITTFDVYDRPKPGIVLLDTRNGRLIRGTDIF